MAMNSESAKSVAYDKFLDNLYLATKGYFSCSNRLRNHQLFSQWIVSFLSVGLIVIPLLQLSHFRLRMEDSTITIGSVVLAIGVLVFSLLISGSNYAARSERMHRCGLQLNHLLREMRYHKSSPEADAKYLEFEKRYSEILEDQENFEDVDYRSALLSRSAKSTIQFRDRLRFIIKYYLGFSPYVIALGIEAIFIYMMVKWPTLTCAVGAALQAH